MEYTWFRYSKLWNKPGLSHLRDHKFKHSFQNFLNPICSCGTEVETTAHYLLHCANYLHERKILLDNIISVFPDILEQSVSFINVLLVGDTSVNDTSITRSNKAFLKSIFSLMQILYIFQYIFLNLVFLVVTICNIPGDCCKCFYVYV